SLADPFHPVFERTRTLPRVTSDVQAVPGSPRVVVRDQDGLRLVRLDTEAAPVLLAEEAEDDWATMATGGTAAAPLVVASGSGAFEGTFTGAVAAWDLGGSTPLRRFRVSSDRLGDRMDA